VIKDPRICRLVPFWRAILREFGANVRVVIPVRNPMEVAASLARRNNFSMAQGLLIWLRHVLDAERETRDLPRGVIRFGDLLHDRQRVLAVLRRRLAVKWPHPVTRVRTEIDDFLSISERHHSMDDRSLDRREEVPVWGAPGLRGSRGYGSRRRDHAGTRRARSDRLTDQAKANCTKTAEIDELRRSFEQRAAEASALQHEITTIRSALLERGADADRVAGELAAARGELTDVRADLARRLAETERQGNCRHSVPSLRTARARWGASTRCSCRVKRRPVNPACRSRCCGVVADREADLARLLPQIDYMLHSFSWRLTAPLRAVRGRLGPGEK
jgi:hypothetical protein